VKNHWCFQELATLPVPGAQWSRTSLAAHASIAFSAIRRDRRYIPLHSPIPAIRDIPAMGAEYFNGRNSESFLRCSELQFRLGQNSQRQAIGKGIERWM
jgi:hypothetical protein